MSSARTVQEASDSEVDWEQSTACLYCDVVSQNRLPSKQAQGMKWSEVVAVDGASGFRCSSSARTVQEASDSKAGWEQSTAYQWFDVVLPPRLSMKQAQCVQLSGCS